MDLIFFFAIMDLIFIKIHSGALIIIISQKLLWLSKRKRKNGMTDVFKWWPMNPLFSWFTGQDTIVPLDHLVGPLDLGDLGYVLV